MDACESGEGFGQVFMSTRGRPGQSPWQNLQCQTENNFAQRGLG